MATLVFNGERIEVQVGESIFDGADRAQGGTTEIATSCERDGSCKECIVQVTRGSDALTEYTDHEVFLEGQSHDGDQVFRLACQARFAQPDAVVKVETFKRKLEIAVNGRPVSDLLEPWIISSNGHVHCDGKQIADHVGPLYGLALDVGTTTVVMHVVDLESGELIAVQAFENPQKYAGSNVMHRISYDYAHPGQLHRTIISHINEAIRNLPIDKQTIFGITVAGNPTVRDLFFGLDVQTIGKGPYVSQTQIDVEAGRRETTALWATAESLGLQTHPQARVYGLPLVSNHVGADTAAVLGTIINGHENGPFMVVDIGTNTEVAIGQGNRLICASCPAGPAFEGGQLSCGMPASQGAITTMRRHNGQWKLSWIGSGSARGLCGSGLVDILAELRASGEMDELGRFQNHTAQVMIQEEPALSFTRSDASELAQAKAANAVGQWILLRTFGISIAQVETFYLAGAFANKINLANARQIGLIPPIADDRVIRIGNASIEGAKAALLSRTCRDRIESLVRTVCHVELEQEPDFFELYVEMGHFKPMPTRQPQ